MSLLSRRQFLHLAGITLLDRGINLNPLGLSDRPRTPGVYHGRTFAPTAVFTRPHASSRVIATLWPDKIIEIAGSSDHWYHLRQGYVPCTAVQPILLHALAPQITSPPFVGEVASPVVSVRQWAAADAPLVTRIGHGGTAHIIDYLPTRDGSGWYALAAPDDNVLGWTQAIHWQPINLTSARYFADLRVEINPAQQQLTLYQLHEPILQTAVSINQPLPTGVFSLQRAQPYLPHFTLPDSSEPIYAAPWHLKIAETYDLCGVYWHNDFGQAAPGPTIQMPVLVARWLYQHLSDNVSVTIV